MRYNRRVRTTTIWINGGEGLAMVYITQRGITTTHLLDMHHGIAWIV